MVEGAENKNFEHVASHQRHVEKHQHLEEVTFEDAVIATEFGKFNILLMMITIPSCFAQVFETVSISYVLPVAQCDLNLALEDKGVLNAMTYAGMITSGFFWGYLCDVLGRKKIMVFGYLLNGAFVIVGSFSPNITLLMISKFFGGFIIVGPFAAATAFLSEFHSSQYRARIQMVRGATLSIANVFLPLMAWGILPRTLDVSLFGFFGFHSWNVFLLMCALAPILSGVGYAFMPESPKFLMSKGRNEDALMVFTRVYRINTGKPGELYPVQHLVEEKSNDVERGIKKSTENALREGLFQMKPLFCAPYIFKLLLCCGNSFLLMMGLNTLKLWLPQMFQAISDYQHDHSGSSSSLCNMLEELSPKNFSSEITCAVNLDNASVYANSMIIGTTRILIFGVAALFVNLLGKKKLVVIMGIATGCFATGIYFAQNSEIVLSLAALNQSSGSVCENILISIVLELFPTSLRTIALSLHMLCGRIGTILGNIIFPYLLYAGCAPPFIFIGSIAFGFAFLSLLYPNTENKALV